VLSKQ